MNLVSRAQSVGVAVFALFAIIAGLVELVVDFKGSYVLGLVFVCAEVLARLCLVIAGVAPSSVGSAVKIVAGGVTAIVIILYAWPRRKNFD